MKLERRSFLAQSVLMGLGATTVINANSKSQPLIEVCEAKPSPADALDAYKILIPQLESEILRDIVKDLVTVCQRYTKLLDELRENVNLLKNEVNKSKKTQIQSIENLIDASKEQVKFIRASVNSNIKVRTTLALINDKVEAELQDLLPKGENTLSPEASRLVNVIVRAIETSLTVQKEVEDEQKRVFSRVESLNTYTKAIDEKENIDSPEYKENINRFIEKAIESIDVATRLNSSNREKSSAKEEAQKQIAGAIAIIEDKLRPMVANKETGLDILETLLLALKGIQGWVAKLEEISSFELTLNNQTSKYVQAKMMPTETANFLVLQDALVRVIEAHCGRGSAVTVAKTISWYLCVVKGLVTFFIISNTPAGKTAALARLLRRLSLSHSCDTDIARQQLASSLARFI